MLNAIIPLSDLKLEKHICRKIIPTLHRSNLSGELSHHRIGDKRMARKVGGALGVEVVITYYSGGAKRGSKRNSLGT